MKNEGLKQARERQGLTQLEAALKAGINRTVYAQLEAGNRPCRRTADKVAAALGVEPLAIWPEYETFWRG